MMSAEEQREMDRLKAVNEGLRSHGKTDLNKVRIKELEDEVSKLRNESVQLLRMIGAIAYQNGGKVRVKQSTVSDMIKHAITVWDDLENLEIVISVY